MKLGAIKDHFHICYMDVYLYMQQLRHIKLGFGDSLFIQFNAYVEEEVMSLFPDPFRVYYKTSAELAVYSTHHYDKNNC